MVTFKSRGERESRSWEEPWAATDQRKFYIFVLFAWDFVACLEEQVLKNMGISNSSCRTRW